MSTQTTDQPTAAPPAVSTTSFVVLFGNLWWIRWIWLLAAVVFGGALVVMSFVTDHDESVWIGAVQNWQRWIVGAAGAAVVPVFAKMLVSNGVTRRQVATSAVRAGGALAVLATVFLLLGFALEALVFHLNDWPHLTADGDDASSLAFLARTTVESACIGAGYFAGGWLIGGAVTANRNPFAVLAVVPALVLAAAGELAFRTMRYIDADALGDLRPPLGVGVLVYLALVAVAVVVATRLTRGFVLE